MQFLSQQVSISSSLPSIAISPAPIVIVGTGPVGIRTAQELLSRAPHHPLVLYGGEPWAPYNRVQLSSFLAGDTAWPDLDNALRAPPESFVIQHHHCAIASIDPVAHTVTDAFGRVQSYSSLILAIGAQPHLPEIPGVERQGVYAFHDMSDAQRLLARSTRSHRTIVLGGGVLGIEAARALQRRSTEVTIIQHTDRLMGQQLDETASAMLLEHIRSLGTHVVLGESIHSILGDWTVTGVRLRNGIVLPCDTLLIATGIKPNIQLARAAGLHVGRGITVDDCMRTSAPDIYAVGDCTEHRNQVYGLVGPGLEQAAVAAHCALGGVAHYHGSHRAAQLKVVDLPVFSIGRVGEAEPTLSFQTVTYERRRAGVYRKVVLHGGKLRGAVAIGEWRDQARVQEAISASRRLWPWQLARFYFLGALWPVQQATNITEWPHKATVCICTGVTRGVLGRAVAEGCMTVASLAERTGASRVCGSCRPLLAQLIGEAAIPSPTLHSRWLLWGSLIALSLTFFFVLLQPVPFATSVQGGWKLETLWSDGWWKQCSGYAMLALILFGLLMSARKRWSRFTLADFAWWRVFHITNGVLVLVILCAHTGFSLGRNVNFLLMSSFLSLVCLGSFAGAVTALESRLAGNRGRKLRLWWTNGHLFLFWPFLVLLGLHIFSVYYF